MEHWKQIELEEEEIHGTSKFRNTIKNNKFEQKTKEWRQE